MTLTDGKEFTAESPDAAGSRFDRCLTLEGHAAADGVILCVQGRRYIIMLPWETASEDFLRLHRASCAGCADNDRLCRHLSTPLVCRRKYPVRTPLPMLSSFGESFMRTQASITDFIASAAALLEGKGFRNLGKTSGRAAFGTGRSQTSLGCLLPVVLSGLLRENARSGCAHEYPETAQDRALRLRAQCGAVTDGQRMAQSSGGSQHCEKHQCRNCTGGACAS